MDMPIRSRCYVNETISKDYSMPNRYTDPYFYFRITIEAAKNIVIIHR